MLWSVLPPLMRWKLRSGRMELGTYDFLDSYMTYGSFFLWEEMLPVMSLANNHLCMWS